MTSNEDKLEKRVEINIPTEQKDQYPVYSYEKRKALWDAGGMKGKQDPTTIEFLSAIRRYDCAMKGYYYC